MYLGSPVAVPVWLASWSFRRAALIKVRSFHIGLMTSLPCQIRQQQSGSTGGIWKGRSGSCPVFPVAQNWPIFVISFVFAANHFTSLPSFFALLFKYLASARSRGPFNTLFSPKSISSQLLLANAVKLLSFREAPLSHLFALSFCHFPYFHCTPSTSSLIALPTLVVCFPLQSRLCQKLVYDLSSRSVSWHRCCANCRFLQPPCIRTQTPF